MQNIAIQPHELWDYYKEKKDDLRTSMHRVASNSDYGVEIYITVGDEWPEIVVYVDGEEEFSEILVGSSYCWKTAEEIYEKFLTSKAMDSFGDDESQEEDELIAIEEREQELDDAVRQFYLAVIGGEPYYDGDDMEEMLEDLKERFLEYMAREWEVPIFRPMRMEDIETGEEFYEEYPYECMEFEDGKAHV